MPTAGSYHFVIEQGADFGPRPFTWRDEAGTPVDLTGYTVTMTALRRGRHRIDLTTEDESAEPALYIDPDPTTGRFWLAPRAAETATYAAGQYRYNIETTSPSGAKRRLLEGTLTVDPEVPDQP